MEYLTTKEAAAILAVSLRQAQHLIKTGQLPAHKFSRDWMIDRDVCLAFARVERKPGPKGGKKKK